MKEQSGTDTRNRTLGTVFLMNCKAIPPPLNQMRLAYIHICGGDGSARWKGRMDRKTVSESILGGWWESGGAGAGPHFVSQTRTDAPLLPNDPLQWYSWRHWGGQSVWNGRSGAVHRANMVVMGRQKLSEKSGLARTTFSSPPKVIASHLLHHSVVKDYHEGVVPRSLDCSWWEARRRHILWHLLLDQTGFVLWWSLMQIFLSWSSTTKFTNKN